MAACISGIPVSELNVLHSFYNATNGPSWNYQNFSILDEYADNALILREFPEIQYLDAVLDGNPWNFSSFPSVHPNPCMEDWQGVYCNHSITGTCTVEGLILPLQNLTGSIPSAIAGLQSLRFLILNNNSLLDNLEPLYPLTQLIYIDLFANYFTGTIPSQFSTFPNITFLNLGANPLHGTIPSELGLVTTLRQIYFYYNSLTGTIPTFLGQCTNLLTLNLAINGLTGGIPSQFSSLVKMTNLALFQNELDGPLPDMSMWLDLNFLRVHSNHLTGTLPEYIGSLLQLTEVSIQNNSFYGPLPDNLGDLVDLNTLFVFSNHFTGTVPSSIGGLGRLQYLLLQDNHFHGDLSQIFTSYRNAYTLQVVDFSNNKFTGSIPAKIFGLPNISFISLIGNCFSGSLPDTLCNVSASSAKLTSIIMNGLSTGCDFNDNLFFPSRVTGTIPSCLFTISTLTTLQMCGNGFVGTLPNLLLSSSSSLSSGQGELSRRLKTLLLTFNRLSGSIPLAFKQASFEEFDLSNNHISGTCDDMTTVATNPSAKLTLHDNRLSGLFPDSFHDALNIDILTGNLFGCTLPQNQVQNDPAREKVTCGSSTLNAYFIFFGSCLLFCILVYSCCMPRLQSFHDTSAVHRQTTVETLRDNLKNNIQAVNETSASVIAWSCVQKAEDYLIRMKLWILTCYDGKLMGFDWFPAPQFFIVLFMNEVRRVCTVLCVVIVALFTTYILAVKFSDNNAYSTHTYQYGWIISLSYISGVVPAAVLFILAWVVIGVMLFVFLWSAELLTRTYNSHPFADAWSKKPKLNAKINHKNWKNWTICGLLYILIPVTNLVVIYYANALYVRERVKGNDVSIILQVALVVFKILWNSLAIPFSLTKLGEIVTARNSLPPSPTWNIVMQTWMILFNNVLAPCLVTMIVDSQCFYYQIYPREEVTTSYFYEMCAFVNSISGRCLQYFSYPIETSFEPPFLYSDECSSALVAAYVPVYILMFVYVAFVYPVIFAISMFATHHADNVPKLVTMAIECIPKIFHPARKLGGKENLNSMSLMNVGNVVANITVHLVVLVTFGAACPPLAVIVTIGIWSYTFQWQAVIGRFFLDCSEEPTILNESVEVSNSDDLFPLVSYATTGTVANKLETITCSRKIYVFALFQRNCRGAWRAFHSLKYIVVSVSLFFSLFIFDIVASTQKAAYLILPIAMMCLPIIAIAAFHLFMQATTRCGVDESKVAHSKSSVEVLHQASVRMFNPLRFLDVTENSAQTSNELNTLPNPEQVVEIEMRSI